LEEAYEDSVLIIDGILDVLKSKVGNMKIANSIRKGRYKTADQLEDEGRFLNVNNSCIN
jgi:hypothetical protein